MAIRADVWAPVPGYEGIYEASWYGDVRRLYKGKPPRNLSKYEKKHRTGSRYQVVKLSKEHKSREVKVAAVIYETFAGKPLPGYSIVHKDMDFTNNEYSNLILLSKKELGKLTGASSRRKPVMKLSADYEPLETYNSAREAARENFMSYQTVMDRCNHKVKNPIAPDGCIYIWDDEYDYKSAVFFSKEELDEIDSDSPIRSKSVMKLSADYEPIVVYDSAREAALENHMSHQAVFNRCNHKVKDPFAPDGCIYIWEEEYDYEAAA